LAACGGNVDPEALVESASDAAEGVLDSVNEQLSDTTSEESASTEESAEAAPSSDETGAEDKTHVEVQFKTTCDPAATVGIPAPTEAEVTVRFVNASGRDLVGMWRDTSQSPVQNVEYFQLPDGETYNQETFAGDEWFVQDEEGNIWDYVATAEEAQCVGLYHHFDYEGEAPTANWAELTEYYHACASDAMQSPINLTDATTADLENIDFAYGETAVKILNNGHTVEVKDITGNQITINDTTYALQQFHFHKQSEHTMDGKQYPMEMHLVHKSLDGTSFAVVGVFIEEGAENPAFATVWANLPTQVTPVSDTGEIVNVADLLPTDPLVYRYTGSLTTPPCTEGILWSIMTTPIEMSHEQITKFSSIFETDVNRPVQLMNEQGLQLDTTP
jgi:carbonic anhydrase